jgi:hypothetical protein
MTPREKEIALEAAGRSTDPAAHAKKVLEAEAILRGEQPPFVVWPEGMSAEEMAAWHEGQAASMSLRAQEMRRFLNRVAPDAP